MGRNGADEFEVGMVPGGANVKLMLANEMDHAIRLLPGLRPYMEQFEGEPTGEGRTNYRFFMPDGPELIGLIAWIKNNPGHYDYQNN